MYKQNVDINTQCRKMAEKKRWPRRRPKRVYPTSVPLMIKCVEQMVGIFGHLFLLGHFSALCVYIAILFVYIFTAPKSKVSFTGKCFPLVSLIFCVL